MLAPSQRSSFSRCSARDRTSVGFATGVRESGISGIQSVHHHLTSHQGLFSLGSASIVSFFLKMPITLAWTPVYLILWQDAMAAASAAVHGKVLCTSCCMGTCSAGSAPVVICGTYFALQIPQGQPEARCSHTLGVLQCFIAGPSHFEPAVDPPRPAAPCPARCLPASSLQLT